MIGIVGGVGPFAGLDLQKKILTQTVARSDQGHLTVASLSRPSTIPDRTAYLLGEADLNPARPILEQLHQLEKIGASVAGIPCNTAHAPPIMDVIEHGLIASGGRVRLLNMINEVGHLLQRHYPSVRAVGVLSTTGTSKARVYPLALEPLGFEVVTLQERLLTETLHPAIYDRKYGIKACGYATEKARTDILFAADYLRKQGAQAIILGCTELPLALEGEEVFGLPLIDSTLALARALIRAVDPEKLLPWEGQIGG